MKGLITDSSSFPLTNQRGFEIRPNHYNLVAVSAILINANEHLKMLKPDVCKCLYQDEQGNLTLFGKYSLSNCFLEFSLKYAQKNTGTDSSQGCTGWLLPLTDDTFKMRNPFGNLRFPKVHFRLSLTTGLSDRGSFAKKYFTSLGKFWNEKSPLSKECFIVGFYRWSEDLHPGRLG